MDHQLIEDESGKGNWLVILGCPRPESHTLHDRERQISGPTFAFCAACEHQTGLHIERRDPEADWFVQAAPERLKCALHECHQPAEMQA